MNLQQAWWYNADGVQHWTKEDANAILASYKVFRALCRVAADALWDGYSSNVIGYLPITQQGASPSEAFFSLDHYEDWLRWIRQHKATNGAARQLAVWDTNETAALRSEVKALIEVAGDTPIKVLDLGCGFGRHARDLLQQFPSVVLEGVDINARMITEADNRLYSSGLLQRCDFHVRDASDLNIFPDHYFDLAVCLTNTLGNMPDAKREKMLAGTRRVLRPGGMLIVSVYGESSVAARKESYQAIGLSIAERGSKIIAAEGLESEYFTENGLTAILRGKAGFRIRGAVKELNGIGLFAVAENP